MFGAVALFVAFAAVGWLIYAHLTRTGWDSQKEDLASVGFQQKSAARPGSNTAPRAPAPDSAASTAK
jgi:hypothetical protein